MPAKIKIAFLWHMHQPYYKDPYTRKMELPWVRLHGLKDYYGMVSILKDFPRVKATYNLVPSLLTQLEDYSRGERDIFQDIFSKDPGHMELEEIHFLVRHFFSANPDNHIKPWPRYRYLYEKKKRSHRQEGANPSWEKIFTSPELRDLQVLFQLSYFDREYQENDPRIAQLIEKGEGFDETDKRVLETAEKELLAKIVPEYRKYADTGQIEISTTPFYHPILPLLLDPQEGRVANPGLPGYDLHFNWQEDAVFQLQEALDYMEKTFGRRPAGIWPSEGGLSERVIGILDGLGIQWTASDETNLGKSLGISLERDEHFNIKQPSLLYKPYRLKGNNVRIFFRDRHLSDLLGFHYARRPYGQAAQDMVDRLKRIPASPGVEPVVPVMLDGENAWEYYQGSGREFLKELFRLISEDQTLETVTLSQVVNSPVEAGELDHFSPGSWIDGNFDIWIGDKEDRKGWELLEKARNAYEARKSGLSKEQDREIRDYIAIAQGSDWFWWYGRENYTPDLDIFDGLFRKNLRKVYDILGQEPPPEFSVPLSSRVSSGGVKKITPPSAPISPSIDGRTGGYFEWLGAGRLEAAPPGGAMNIGRALVKAIYYGFDHHFLYLRVDTGDQASHYFESDYSLKIIVKKEKARRQFTIGAAGKSARAEAAAGRFIEIAIPLEALALKPGIVFQLQLEWRYKGDYFLAVPANDYFSLTVPTGHDYARSWMV
jgi:alpha-amylase/alpha-mannosidase (GH57 family)